ncbi:MAG TPA: CBS domain-containing protein [Polyangiales bacterium]|jgi:acetoin utilization protein AcuB
MLAEDIMTSNPVTVTERTKIEEALRLMAERDIRHLPVVRGLEVVGILSDRDLRSLGLSLVQDAASAQALRARLREQVTDLMTGTVVTVDADATLRELIGLMLDEKVSALPVVHPGSAELVGIVSYVDVLRAIEEEVE